MVTKCYYNYLSTRGEVSSNNQSFVKNPNLRNSKLLFNTSKYIFSTSYPINFNKFDSKTFLRHIHIKKQKPQIIVTFTFTITIPSNNYFTKYQHLTFINTFPQTFYSNFTHTLGQILDLHNDYFATPGIRNFAIETLLYANYLRCCYCYCRTGRN